MDEGYVAVRDEPRHRRRFEDDHVRVYDVLIPPGDTTLYHHHTEDTFYVAVNDAIVRNQVWGSDEARDGHGAGGDGHVPRSPRPTAHPPGAQRRHRRRCG